MTQIILVDADKELTTVLRTNLFKKFGWEVIVKETASEAISILQILSEVELIIARETNGKDSSAKKICDYLISSKDDFSTDIPVLVIGNAVANYPKCTSLDPSTKWEQIITAAGTILGRIDVVKEPILPRIQIPKPVEEVAKPTREPVTMPVPEPVAPVQKVTPKVVLIDDYLSLSTRLLLNLDGKKIAFDCFTRTKNKDHGFDYQLKIGEYSDIERSGIERMIMRGVGEIFVSKKYYEQAQKFVFESLLEKVRDTSIAGLDRVLLSSDIFDITLEELKHQELNDSLIKLTEENIKALSALIKAQNIFALFNNGVKIKKISYGFAHTFLSSILLNKLIPGFDWVSADIKEKIPCMAYFHDIALHNDKLIKIHHHYFQEAKNLSADDASIVLQHALKAAQLAEKFNIFPPELIPMLKEHHGIKSGKGFSESLSIIISPLAMSFLTIEEFVTRYLDITEDITPAHLKSIFTEMEKKYNKMSYGLTLKALQELYK